MNGTTDPRRPFVVAHVVGVMALALWFILTGGTTAASATEGDATPGPAAAGGQAPADGALDGQTLEVPALPEIPAEVDLRKATLVQGRYVQRLSDGSAVTLTVDPATQQAAERALDRHPIQFGSVVALEPSTGKLLALAEVVNDRAAAGPGRPATQAHHPAASVFKMVTTAALLEQGGVRAGRRVCVHGGTRGLSKREIVGDRRLDKRCRRFSEALGHSDNAIYARLAYHRLTPEKLVDTGLQMGWTQTLDVPWKLRPSVLDLPADDHLEFARTSAGFWNTTLSPVHAAVMTAGVANGGVMRAPVRVERWVGADGVELPVLGGQQIGRMMKKRTAHILTRMMVETTTRGTGRRAFGKRRDWPWRGRVEVASKTGSLSRYEPQFTSYSWFVAFAPADDPKIAVAVLVGNPEKWYVKAVHVARETLAAFLSGERERRALASVD